MKWWSTIIFTSFADLKKYIGKTNNLMVCIVCLVRFPVGTGGVLDVCVIWLRRCKWGVGKGTWTMVWRGGVVLYRCEL